MVDEVSIGWEAGEKLEKVCYEFVERVIGVCEKSLKLGV